MQDEQKLPHIDVVIIGVNASATLAACLTSVLVCDYPLDRLNPIYVDGGSSDGSTEIALRYEGVSVIALNDPHPTPGKGRNAGYRAGRADLVMFLDADTRLDPDFLRAAVAATAPGTGACLGLRRERRPDRCRFNWIADQEWNQPAGSARSFGGDVLLRREALEAVGGYDEELVAGEDPELSRRLIAAGWTIRQLGIPMTEHDIAMHHIAQYWRRAYRSGHAFAAVRSKLGHRDPFWRREHRRILVRGVGGLTLLLAGALGPFTAVAAIPFAIGLLLLLKPVLTGRTRLGKALSLSRGEAWIYALHCSLVVIPQSFGLLRFYLGRLIGKPLRNRATRLATQG